jgi:hypothetical protein
MRLATSCLGCILALSACSADDDGAVAPHPGHEHGPCHQGACLEGLACIEDVCTEPTAGGETSSTSIGSDGEPDLGTDGEDDDEAGGTADGGRSDDGQGDPDGGADTDPGGSVDCNPPVCASYEAKLESCFPDWNYDSYEECVYIFEVCNGIGSDCAEKTPTVVNCRLSASCEDLFDCNQGMQC